MSETYTETSYQSWGGRIKGAIGGILFGLIMFLGSFGLLFWNEGRTVKRTRVLEEGAASVVTVSTESVDATNEGKLVHMTGQATTDEVLKDKEFGVSINAIKLKRVAEMYQWDEREETKTRKKTGGGTEKKTTYYYNKTWSQYHIDSNGFKDTSGHENPSSMPYSSEEWTAKDVKVGAYSLSSGLVDEIDNFTGLAVEESQIKKLPKSTRKKAKANDGMIYMGRDPVSPEIGDMRISFQAALPTVVSLVSKQIKNSFMPYKMEYGFIELLEVGSFSSDEMFRMAQQQNKLIAWAIRAGGFVVMLIGIFLIFRPLAVMADVLPILGSLLGAGLLIFSTLIAFSLSLLTISIAWIVYRPLIGIPLLALAVLGIVALAALGLKKRAKTAG